MSTCVSRFGEYSSHKWETDQDGVIVCTYCAAIDQGETAHGLATELAAYAGRLEELGDSMRDQFTKTAAILDRLGERITALEQAHDALPKSPPTQLSTPMITSAARLTAGFHGAGQEWPIRLDPIL